MLLERAHFCAQYGQEKKTCLLRETLKKFFFLVEQTLHWLTNFCHLIEKFITQSCLRLFLAYAGLHLK